MIYHDRKSYEEYRDVIVQLLKPIKIGLIGLIALSAIGCYNAAMMRVSGEARDTCQSDSDCEPDYMCVKNISPNSTLGECVSVDNYDPWANRQLEDIIKLKDKKKEKVKEEPPAIQPQTNYSVESDQIRRALRNLLENAIVDAAAHAQRQKLINRTKQCQCPPATDDGPNVNYSDNQ